MTFNLALYMRPHFGLINHYVEFVFLGRGMCLTFFVVFEFFLKLVVRGEAYDSSLSNKILCFEFVFLG